MMAETCTHPARIHGKDGVLRCITCGAEILPEKPEKKPAKKAEDKTEDKAAE